MTNSETTKRVRTEEMLVEPTLEELRRQEEILKRAALRARERRTDWDNPAAKAEYIREQKRKARQRLLDDVVPDRKCPGCNRTVLKSRGWVVTISQDESGKRTALCRGCWQRGKSR